jgi:hypothetical protein
LGYSTLPHIGAPQTASGRRHIYCCQIVDAKNIYARRHISKELLQCLHFFVEYKRLVFETVIVFVIVNMQGRTVESTFQLAYAEFGRHKQDVAKMYALQEAVGRPACSPAPPI